MTYYDRENVAFAVDTEKGLLTPVVKDAATSRSPAWPRRSRTSPSAPAPTRSAPTTCPAAPSRSPTSAAWGALWDTPIINKPQVAILGPGTVVKRAVVIDDPNLGETIAVRHMVYLALTYDHQLVDGADDAGRFLQDVKKRLEAGQFEV